MKRFGIVWVVFLAGILRVHGSAYNVEATYEGDGVYAYTFFAGTLPLFMGLPEADPSFTLFVTDVDAVTVPADWSYTVLTDRIDFTYTGTAYREVTGERFYPFGREVLRVSFHCAHDPAYFGEREPPEISEWLGGYVIGTLIPESELLGQRYPAASMVVGIVQFTFEGVPQYKPFDPADVEFPYHFVATLRDLHPTLSVVGDRIRLEVSDLVPGRTYAVLRRGVQRDEWDLVGAVYTLDEGGTAIFETPLVGGEGLYRVTGWE